MNWSLADAKNKFSEVVRLALNEGPQRVSRRGETVVVLSELEFQRLKGARRGLKAYLAGAPDLRVLDLSRDTTSMRDVKL